MARALRIGRQAGLALGLAGLLCCCNPIGRMDPVADTASGQGITRLTISVGDRVRVLTVDGKRSTFDITGMEPTALIGKKQRVEFADMVFVERLYQSAGHKAATSALAISSMMLLVGAGTGVSVIDMIKK